MASPHGADSPVTSVNEARPTVAADSMISRTLFGLAWVSACLFGAYILVFYGGAIFTRTMHDWNDVLPQLYAHDAQPATVAIGVHFFAGVVVLVLGPLQFIRTIRERPPLLHRMVGRTYALATFCAGVGGLAYLSLKGAVGGVAMNLGFGLYGCLIVLATVNTFRHAVARRIDLHRAWAIRLFALGIGSWLYRMDYGIWLKVVGGLGHTHSFDGPFDVVMDFFFYVPNLIIAEAIIRWPNTEARRGVRVALYIAAPLLAVATFLFAKSYWIPHVVARYEQVAGP
ncbi:DUF2306 domain-containing protein [Burkholderia ambifaria]|uniref:DUF2306 domain-containing protein n=1 Tax=Burkholderia ambifaria IOP40-10 TaxID=396596 RepID=B1FBG9_9BURK|nr:DUF2306 domain-containing protein [Burkholderia ambifaria]EDT05071.1 conserved hypothetical protein [Burkholderia ambifaria IOP40-10]